MSRHHDCHENSCYSVIPNGEDVYITRNDCDVQVDITAERVKSVVVWGHVHDCNHKPIENALVKLLKYINNCGTELRGVCHTYTDCNGFYQFDLASGCEGKYRIMVSKSAFGNERNATQTKYCDPCGENPPCDCHKRNPCHTQSCGYPHESFGRCANVIRNHISYY